MPTSDVERRLPDGAVAGRLTVASLVAGYTAGIDILRGVTLETRAGRITVVIGPNGAGKSTLLKTIFGFLAPRGGSVAFEGTQIGGFEPHAVKRLGIGYIPQQINTFPSLTVEENLKMGGWKLRREPALLRERLDAAYSAFPILADRRGARASSLSGGQARMLSVARELMTQPRLILIDEPTAGLAPSVVPQVYALLRDACARSSAAILLVDQNIDGAIGVADEVYLLDLGRVRTHGDAAEFTPARTRELIRECLRG